MGESLLAYLHSVGGGKVGRLHLCQSRPLSRGWASIPLQVVMAVDALVAGGADALPLLPPHAQGSLVLVVRIGAGKGTEGTGASQKPEEKKTSVIQIFLIWKILEPLAHSGLPHTKI